MNEESKSLTFILNSREPQRHDNARGVALHPRFLGGTPLWASSYMSYAKVNAHL